MSFASWLDAIHFMLTRIASDSNTPGIVLDILSRYQHSAIQQRILYNLNCDVSTLIRLSNNENTLVLCGVFWNRNTPFYILEKLSLNECRLVRRQFYYDKSYDRQFDKQFDKLRVSSENLNFLFTTI